MAYVPHSGNPDTQYGAYRAALRLLETKFPSFATLWQKSQRQFSEYWLSEMDRAIGVLIAQGNDLGYIVDGYAAFCTDAVRSQVYFERHGKYRAQSYADVTEACYMNEDFMMKSYLPGMLLSHYVWPHHHRMLLWWRSLLPQMGEVRDIAEVGVGCGMYSKEALSFFQDAKGIGFDISPHALDFTKRLVTDYGYGDRYHSVVRDIIAAPPGGFDLVISQEVLEHLEDPLTFIRALRAMTKPGRYAYISAAINAGHVDHIYLYRSPDEVEEQLWAANFTVVTRQSELAYEGKPLALTPCHAAFLCRA